MLYIIATPIGNLGDFSKRACEVILECDYLLCEDTRRTGVLLKHYEIKRPLKSFHKFNEKRFQEQVLDDLKEGSTIGLVSDAGTPTVSDPGQKLIAGCIQENLEYTVIPGASSVLAALVLSGFDPQRFQFLGFLPKTPQKRKNALQEAVDYLGVTLFFESPHRLVKTLKALSEIAPDQPLCVCREITKKFEQVFHGTAQEVHAYWQDRTVKGEIVIVIDAKS